MMRSIGAMLAAAVLAMPGGFGSAAAQDAKAADDAGGLTVELNKLETVGTACRAYLVVQNGTGAALSSLKLDLVMFGGDGVITKRLAVETAPLPVGKTSVRLFDMEGLACDGISRVLLNDVLACDAAEGATTTLSRDRCLDMTATESRAGAAFVR